MLIPALNRVMNLIIEEAKKKDDVRPHTGAVCPCCPRPRYSCAFTSPAGAAPVPPPFHARARAESCAPARRMKPWTS